MAVDFGLALCFLRCVGGGGVSVEELLLCRVCCSLLRPMLPRWFVVLLVTERGVGACKWGGYGTDPICFLCACVFVFVFFSSVPFGIKWSVDEGSKGTLTKRNRNKTVATKRFSIVVRVPVASNKRVFVILAFVVLGCFGRPPLCAFDLFCSFRLSTPFGFAVFLVENTNQAIVESCQNRYRLQGQIV